MKFLPSMVGIRINVDDSYETYYGNNRDRSIRSPYHHWLVDKGYAPDVERPSGPIFGRGFVADLPECHSSRVFKLMRPYA